MTKKTVTQNVKRISDLPQKCTPPIILDIPKQFRRGSLRDNQIKSVNSALENFRGIAQCTGLDDWSDLAILDYGCGVKFSQALHQFNLPIKSYTGMDVFTELITHLDKTVDKSNFHFYPVPFHNDMYNTNGIKMEKDSELPGSIRLFDLITLQSVFTHFEPNDFQTMLHILRKHIQDSGKLVFTCFIDNEMDCDFRDDNPERPLLRAYYKESFIRDMITKADWKIETLRPRSFQMNPHFVCTP